MKKTLRKLRDYIRSINPHILSSYDRFFIPGAGIPHSRKCLEHNIENMKNEKVVVFISSRNNYDMMANELLVNADYGDFLVFNVDDGSNEEQVKQGTQICRDKNIVFLKNEKNGLQWGLKTVVNYLDEHNYSASMVLHVTHDNYPIVPDFKKNVEDISNSEIYAGFGMIGFNHLDYRMTRDAIIAWKKNKPALGLLGRMALVPKSKGENWYNEKVIAFNPDAYSELFSVECVADMGFMINRKLFTKYIEVSDDYRLHLWGDDIGMQFLQNNIHNAAVKDIYFYNCQELKRKYKIIVNSVEGTKNIKTEHHSDYGNHLAHWEKRWGWKRDYVGNLAHVKDNYNGTLIAEYISHDFHSGPLCNFREI